ncbi:AI-2E family transporter [Halopiger djelfimassiliensis]|uniref:AI-2E family transporter n=1 Tax=Halopiger djelfimassiliensis TaxID=1293047 RepID=UPI000677A106|nr:AI-2E family transporter [Halopiger djelfimassiliensis]
MNRSKGFLLALILLFAYLSWQLVAPFLQYVLAAILTAFVLSPLQNRLETRFSPGLSAFILVALTVVGVIVPFVLIAAAVAGDAARILQDVDPESLQLAELESRIEATTGVEVDLAETLTGSAQEVGTVVLEQSTAWFGAITHALVGIGLALFLLYYLLKDGTALVRWLRDVTPLPEDIQDDFYGALDEVMWAVLAGHVLIAIIQGFIAGLGLVATGIPNAAFWTVVMIVLALIPLVGSFLVWGPAVGYLFLTGEPVLGVALFVYGSLVVGVADDYLRPILVDRYAKLNPAIIILGVLGGLYAFGVMGLFFGPVVLGALIATINVADDYYERRAAESEP